MKNIVLIGMPGCGKSTAGIRVARELGCAFVETDSIVEGQEGLSISEVFATYGEDYFRDSETTAAQFASRMHDAILSTGGGMILRPENMAFLSATGHIVFIDRDPTEIAREDHCARPLLAHDRERVFKLYTDRISLYRKYAEYIVEAGTSPAETAARILALDHIFD